MRSTRREFVSAAAAAALSAAPPGPASPPSPRRPNVLFLFSDEHRAQSWPPDVAAPNMARLASEGVTFSQCVSNYPVCSPYRAMLLSGRWPFSTGVIDNALPLPPEETSLGEAFHRAGYVTGYIGKWHLQGAGNDFVPPGPSRLGFDHWLVWYATNSHFNRSFWYDDQGKKLTPPGYNASLMTDQALDFIDRRREASSPPWFLMVSWNPPHPNYRDAPPAQLKLYDPAALPLRPNVAMQGARLERLRFDYQGYNAHITAVDAELGRLLRKLDETGLAQHTIVVYTSDHGDMMGSQGRMGKRLPYEESALVPFLARWPGRIQPGLRRAELLGTIDLYPTLCALAGVPVPPRCEGRDLSRAFLGAEAQAPDSAFLMHIDKRHASGGLAHPAPIFRGVRTARYTYAAGETGPWLLFDNREDPFQLHNLVRDPARQKLRSDLEGLTAEWLRRAHDPFPWEAAMA